MNKWITRILIGGGAIIGLVMAASLVYDWLKWEDPVTKVEYREVPKIVERVKVVEIPIEKIVIIDREDLEKKIPKLAETIKEKEEVTATGVIPPYKGKTDVASVIDTESGKSKIVAKRRPLSTFQLMSETEIGTRLGISTYGGLATDIYGRWTFLRIKKGYFGIYAEGSGANRRYMGNEFEAKLMLDFSLRF